MPCDEAFLRCKRIRDIEPAQDCFRQQRLDAPSVASIKIAVKSA